MTENKDRSDEFASFAAATRHLLEVRSAPTFHLVPQNDPSPSNGVPTQHLVPAPAPAPPPEPAQKKDG